MNTKDNTPAIIHYEIVDGDQVDITVAPKGFGSENMSRVFMLKPADGIEGVKEKILEAVRDAGPNACPPMVVGVGIGGTFEKCALMAKHALTRYISYFTVRLRHHFHTFSYPFHLRLSFLFPFSDPVIFFGTCALVPHIHI